MKFRMGDWVFHNGNAYSDDFKLVSHLSIGQVVDLADDGIVTVRFINGGEAFCYPNLCKVVSPERAAIEIARQAFGIKGDRVTIRRPPTFSTTKET